MSSLLCKVIKFRICHGIFLCPVLIIVLLCWISYSAFMCWMSVTMKTKYYLQSFPEKLCPAGYYISGKTVSSSVPKFKTLGLLAKLLEGEYQSEKSAAAMTYICEQPESLSKTSALHLALPGSCVPLRPHTKDCLKSEQKEAACDQKQHIICELKVNPALPAVPDVFCHETCQSQLSIGLFNKTVGHVTWTAVSTITKLQSQILHLINPLVTPQNHSGFCFIRCILKETNQSVTQLLVLPPNLNYLNKFKGDKQEFHHNEKQYDVINFNVVILEGISRYRFWKKLPRTVEKLKVLQNSDVKLFDFEVVQNSGSVPLWKQIASASWNTQEPVFKTAASYGYQTLWLEDGCPNHKISTNYSHLVHWMSQANVLDVGPSVAFCETRSWNVNEQPCFNGLSWSDYSLKYLHHYQTVLAKVRQPYITVFHSHVGNDLLQRTSVDELLAKHVEFSANQESTLTVIVSYPSSESSNYPGYLLNGASVAFLPVMFVIVPKFTKWNHPNSSDFMQNLIANQKRLVTAEELCKSIKYLMKSGHSGPGFKQSSEQLGLLADIHLNRSCEDIILQPVTTCICEGFQIPVENRKHVTLLAEYAVSELNAMLQKEFDNGVLYLNKIGRRVNVISTCRRLIGNSVSDVRQALIQNDRVLTVMTIEMKTHTANSFTSHDNLTGHSSHELGLNLPRFRVSLEQNIFVNARSSSIDVKLVSYKRLDNYLMYEECSGGLITVDLCHCDPYVDKIITQPVNRTQLYRGGNITISPEKVRNAYKYFDPSLLITAVFYQFGSRTMVHSLDPNAEKQCIFVVYRIHDVGANFEAVNVCYNQEYELAFSIKGRNLCYSDSLAVSHQVAPLSVVHLVTVLQQDVEDNWFLRYQVQYRKYAV